MLVEGSARIELESRQQIVVVVDGSESAQEQWPNICRAVALALEKLPGHRICLYFLGNPNPYAATEFPTRSNQWRKENLRRGSFIAPVLRSLGTSFHGRIWILGNGTVHDLPDWRGDPVWHRIVLVNGGASLGSDPSLECGLDAMSDLIRGLHCPKVSVKILGKAFMPYWWDQKDYLLQTEEGSVWLTAPNGAPSSIQLSFFAEEVCAEIVGENGTEVVNLEITAPRLPEECWDLLTASEQQAFSRALNGQSFTCPQCKTIHPADAFLCEKSGCLVDQPVYPSLQGKRGFFIFQQAADRVRFRHHPLAAVRLGKAKVALAQNHRAVIYQYDGAAWRKSGEMQSYQLLDNGHYLAVAF